MGKEITDKKVADVILGYFTRISLGVDGSFIDYISKVFELDETDDKIKKEILEKVIVLSEYLVDTVRT